MSIKDHVRKEKIKFQTSRLVRFFFYHLADRKQFFTLAWPQGSRIMIIVGFIYGLFIGSDS